MKIAVLCQGNAALIVMTSKAGQRASMPTHRAKPAVTGKPPSQGDSAYRPVKFAMLFHRKAALTAISSVLATTLSRENELHSRSR